MDYFQFTENSHYRWKSCSLFYQEKVFFAISPR